MGFGGVSAWQLLILLLIIGLLFGSKRLRNMGGDLGSALRSFRQGFGGEEATTDRASEKATTRSLGTDLRSESSPRDRDVHSS